MQSDINNPKTKSVNICFQNLKNNIYIVIFSFVTIIIMRKPEDQNGYSGGLSLLQLQYNINDYLFPNEKQEYIQRLNHYNDIITPNYYNMEYNEFLARKRPAPARKALPKKPAAKKPTPTTKTKS